MDSTQHTTDRLSTDYQPPDGTVGSSVLKTLSSGRLTLALTIALCTAVLLFFLERVAVGRWQSVGSFLSTMLLVFVAATALAKYKSENGAVKSGVFVGLLLGTLLGVAYGASTGSVMRGVFSTACLGVAIGWATASGKGLPQVLPVNINGNIRVAGSILVVLTLSHFVGITSPRFPKKSHDRKLVTTPASGPSAATSDQSNEGRSVEPPKATGTPSTQPDGKISYTQFKSIPEGLAKFQVEDLLGPPRFRDTSLKQESIVEDGKIFGTDFTTGIIFWYEVTGVPSGTAVFIFVGDGTNPPLVEKMFKEGVIPKKGTL